MNRPDQRPASSRWTIVALLMAAAAINYLLRSCMGMAAPKIQIEFGLTTTQIGYVLGAFQYGYLLSYLFSGMLVDRLGARRSYILIMAAWSAVGILTALGTRLWQFVTFRFLLGVAEAGCWPASNKVVARCFPLEERPLACGLFDSGSSLAQVFGPPALAFIILRWGWRSAFPFAGILGFIWIPLWMWKFRNPEAHGPGDGIKDTPEPRAVDSYTGWKQLLRCRQVWGIFVLNASTVPLWFVLFNWLPKYFYDARGISFRELGWYSALPMVGAPIGGIGGSAFLGWLLRRPGMTSTVARQRMFLVSVLMMSAFAPAVRSANVIYGALFMTIAAAGLGLHSANLLSSISDLVPSELVATATSIQASATFLYALPIATFAGWIAEHLGYSTLFMFGALTPWFTIVSVYFIIRKFEPIAAFRRDQPTLITD
jgi:MFS family permease